ncbi:YjbF family lipoprotein [Dyella flava]|uniref:YjbF family lipoprotein n=2 Tax=Dyella flava TaxID=1920170 RepID=A0ABS2K110_9GAMM|nr:YjbF family lipoprotein [Dyella flava]
MKLVANSHFSKAPTLEQVNANPYAQLEVQTAQEGQVVLVLGNVDGTREVWYGNPHVAVFTEHGRVVQTVGFNHDLDGLHAPADDPFVRGLQMLAVPTDYIRTEDWAPGYRYGVIVNARLVPAGRTQITILGVPHTVLRVDEELSAPAAGYRATNHYWVDPGNGFVWKSEQHVSPELTLTLTVLRPYRGSQP